VASARRAGRHRACGPALVHLLTNTALTGATYDVDGGQQMVS
jgi:hypothetical protein